MKEAHAANNATGAADRQAARGCQGGKGAYRGRSVHMCSILVAWDWESQGTPTKKASPMALAGSLKRFLGQPSHLELSYIGDAGMDYCMGFTIVGLHRNLVVRNLGLHDDPLTPHEKSSKNAARRW